VNPKKVLEEFGLETGARVADFGAGSGYFPTALAKAVGPGGRVVAIDVLPSALELIEGRAKNDHILNIETRRANLEVPASSGLDANSMDFVLLANLLHQSYQKSAIIKEAKRVLRQGGRAACIEYLAEARAFGPRSDMRLDKQLAVQLFKSEGFSLLKEFKAGEYHYGLLFEKK